ncbi:hypothetical protein [Amycolatopsis marina]
MPAAASSPTGPTYADRRAAEEESERRAAAERMRWRHAKDRIVGLLASVVRWVGLVFAAILVLHVIFVIGDANPENGIVSFVTSWSESLSLGFSDLFTPDDAKLRVLINYGIAAIFWMVVTAVLAKIIRRVGGSSL